MDHPRKSNQYWSVYRESVRQGRDESAPLPPKKALAEIERAIRDAFPAASEVTARADVSDVLVKFVAGQKSVSVRFSDGTLRAYSRCPETFRQQALKTLRLVCNFAFAREYAAGDDPVNPFVIDAETALSNIGS
jgi:hypothetical protein